jgi:hypothetical protein
VTAPERPLSFSRLDRDLTVWGVAFPLDSGIGGHRKFLVRAEKSRREAEFTAEFAGLLPVRGALQPVLPLVYHAPDGRWVFAATGHSFRTPTT